jgi:hypothetical protein
MSSRIELLVSHILGRQAAKELTGEVPAEEHLSVNRSEKTRRSFLMSDELRFSHLKHVYGSASVLRLVPP